MESIDPNQLNLNAIPILNKAQKSSKTNVDQKYKQISQDIRKYSKSTGSQNIHDLPSEESPPPLTEEPLIFSNQEKKDLKTIKDMLSVLPGRMKHSILKLEASVQNTSPHHHHDIKRLKQQLEKEFNLKWDDINALDETAVKSVVEAFETLDPKTLSPRIATLLQNKI